MKTYKVLIFAPNFTPYGITENNPEAVVNRKLVLAMLDAGWHVDVITQKIIFENEPVKDTVWKSPWKRLETVTHEIPYFNGMGKHLSGWLKLFMNAVSCGYYIDGMGTFDKELKLAFELHAINGYDVVISRSVPDTAHMLALMFHRKTGIPWIANFNDPNGSKLPRPFEIKLPNIFNYLLKAVLKDVSLGASAMTFPSERMLKYITGYLGENTSQKSFVIPHIAYNFPIPSQIADNEVFTIGYAGSLDKVYRSPETFFKAFSFFVEKNNLRGKIKLNLMGDFKDNIFNTLKAGGFLRKEVNLLGNLDYLEMLSEIGNCDLSVIIEAPFEEGYFLPSKLMDYIQSGTAVLAVSPKNSVLNDIISSNGGGIAADCRSVESIETTLGSMYSSWQHGLIRDKYNSKTLGRLFSSESVIDAYRKIFTHLKVNGSDSPEKAVNSSFENFHYSRLNIDKAFIDGRAVSTCNSFGWQSAIFHMLRLGFDFSKMRTLEIGCGTGTFSLTLNLLGAQTTLLDADEEAIEAAKKCFSLYGLKAEYITSDVSKPLPEMIKSKFDFVISGGLAEHFTGDQRTAVIKYHRQALNNNGLAYIAVPNALSPYYRFVIALMKLSGQWEIETEIPYTPSELIKLAAAAGFAKAEVIGLIDTKRDIISHALAAGSVILKLMPVSAVDSFKKMGIYSILKRMEPVQYREIDLKHFILESVAKVKDSPKQNFLNKGIKDSLSSNLVLLGFSKNND